MNFESSKRFICLSVALLCAYGLTGCQGALSAPTGLSSGASSASTASTTSTVSTSSLSVQQTATAADESWDAASAVAVNFAGSTITAQGPGIAVDGSTLTISAAGTYLLTGTLTDGQVLVDVGKQDTVRLILNGVNLSNSQTAPIYIKQAGTALLTLADGTQNSVSDGTAYVYPDATTDEPNAAIFSKGDLSINGAGSLRVSGNYQNGIGTKDNLLITNGNITVTAANDGLRGRDSVTIDGGTFTIDATGDGIQANNDEDAAKGWISITGGSFTITTQGDGIQAETALQISGGDYQITTGGGSVNGAVHTESAPQGGRANAGVQSTAVTTATTATTATTDQTISTKALKAGGDLTVSGGNLLIDAQDDSVHSNSNVTIQGGTLEVRTGDDGIHADGALTINSGSIDILQSYEGLEGSTVTINDGTIHLVASDDGVNAAGGSDDAVAGAPQDNFRSDSAYFIRVSGGLLCVDASGDGLDSNGDLYLDGGTVLVNGPTNSGNGTLDFNGKCENTGGVLITAGSAGMLQTPADSSTVNALAVVYSTPQQAGTLVSLAAQDGTTLLSFAPAKEYQSVVISAPSLSQGTSYTLSTGGTTSATATDGYSTGGTLTGSTKLTDVTLSAVITRISEDGSAVTGGMGGMGGMGGKRGGSGVPAA